MADPAQDLDLDLSDLDVVVQAEGDESSIDPATGALTTRSPDGGVVVEFNPRSKTDADDEDAFYENLAKHLSNQKLGAIANDLLEAIESDDRSRQEALDRLAKGLELLGLKLEEPKSEAGTSSAPVEGMSVVRHPVLLEAILRGWANSQAELLPSTGPVKVQDDGDETIADADLADALAKDMNHYLTRTAAEFIPDTSHMLLWGVHFGGKGIKKIYRCPMRRRPVSESVPIKDFIVSDATKTLDSCERITHRIMMRPNVMKRMKLIGAYLDTRMEEPVGADPNAVDRAIAGIQGVSPTQDMRPEDRQYEVFETQCELDPEQVNDNKVPKRFRGDGDSKGLALPYLVTLDKGAREILAIRRDWHEDDEECRRKRLYNDWPYVPGPGFYGTGLLHILGNSASALTAAWREALDAGMFASFPAWLVAKLAGRQLTSNMRAGPGEGILIETNNLPINQVVSPMPLRDVTPGLMTMIDKVQQAAQRVGGTAELPVGEGRQDAPVGTTLALIEQATKIMAAAHKGMHTALTREIEMLIDLFREHPEDFWRQNQDCATAWDEQRFITAITDCKLVPVSDPNVPSQMHRIAKKLGLIQLAQNPSFAPFLNMKEILIRTLRVLGEVVEGLVVDPPPQAPGVGVDPARAAEAQARLMQAQTDQQEAQVKAQGVGMDAQLQAAKLASQEKVAQMNLEREQIIHAGDAAREAAAQAHQQRMDVGDAGREAAAQAHQQQMAARAHDLEVQKHGLAMAQARHDANMDIADFLRPTPPSQKTKESGS